MSNFTAGPWHVKTMPHSICNTGGVQSPNGTWVAKVHPLNGETDKVEWMANAHLLAAAPELLEALEAILEAYAQPKVLRQAGVDFNALHPSVNQSLRAIAKAKGEQP